MPTGIILLGPSGSGKTTLGKLVAQKLKISFLDIDEYIWRKDTAVPYTAMYSKPEKIKRLMDAAQKAGKFVMAGSMDSFHEHFDPFFRLAVYLTADEALRRDRVHLRELKEFGGRILPGGDMYDAHQSFLADVSAYDRDAESCCSAQHELWLRQLSCPVLRMDGGDDLENNAAVIIRTYRSQFLSKSL